MSETVYAPRQIVPITDHLPVQQPASEAGALISMIERVARDPSADLDKLERLITLRERIKAQEAKERFEAAMTAAQKEMRPISADAENKQTNSKYATHAKLDAALRPIYTKHGFSLSFYQGETDKPDHVRVCCKVSAHGHDDHPHIDMPADGKGAKGGDVMTKTHATGSAFTYGSRYLLKMIFNVAVGEVDDDGNAAGDDRPRITQEQADAIRDLLEAKGKDKAKFLRWAKVQRIENIPAEVYQSCVDAINAPVRA